MITGKEITPFPREPLLAQLNDLRLRANSNRGGTSADSIVMQTTQGVTVAQDPLRRRSRSMNTGSIGPARWG